MKPLILFLLLSTAAWGQDTASIKGKWNIHTATYETVQKDTVPVTLLVRISGKPWAFFHDGWEVRKIDTLPGILVEAVRPGESVSRTYPNLKHSHLLYLDSRKRPIRKEWVVYQTFKR